jgi:hypothetical protein
MSQTIPWRRMMNKFSNDRVTAMVGRSKGWLACLVGVATIITIATVPPATGQESEPGPPPTVIRVSPEESKQILSAEMQERIQEEASVERAQWLRLYAVVVYIDPAGRERVLSIGPFSEEQVELDAFQFLVPPFKGYPEGPGKFEQGVVIFTGSPAGARSCGSTGGTHIRGCNY